MTPTRTERKEERVQLRATHSQLDVIDRAAALVHKSRTDFMLDVATDESRRIIVDQELFVLDNVSRDQFLAALAAPPQPVPELRSLFARGSVLGQASVSEPLAG